MMKKQIYLTAIFVCCCCLVYAQWLQVNGYPVNGNASSMVFINNTMIVSSTGNVHDMTPGFFTSTNHGNTWSAKNTSLGVSAYPVIADGDYLYTGTLGQGVYVSTDYGTIWTDKNNGLPASFDVSDLIITNSGMYVCGSSGLFHSPDSATTWENISLPGIVLASSVITAGDTIMASFLTQTDAGVYKSTDNGANWTLITSASGLNDTRIRKFASFNHTILAAANGDIGTGNVYVSTNNGISWTIGNGLNDLGHNYPMNFLAFNNTIFLATANGVYKSSDDGLNWINTGCSNALSLAIVGDTLFAGTGFHGISKRGVYEMTGKIEGNQDNGKLVVYPDPASDKINVGLKGYPFRGNMIVSICNIQGKLVLQKPLQKDKTTLDISGFENGVYLLKVTNDKMSEVTKFVKK